MDVIERKPRQKQTLRRPKRSPAASTSVDQPRIKPVLTSVLVVCKGNAFAAALSDVVSIIDEFAANVSSQWNFESASAHGHVRLLNHLQEWNGVSPELREARFEYAIKCAIHSENLDVLDWWMTKYLPGNNDLVVKTVLAADAKRAKVLQWLFEQGKLPLDHPNWRVKEIYYIPDVAYWISEHIKSACMVLGVNSESDFGYIKWSHEQQQLGTYELVGVASVLDSAIRNGNMEILIWVHANRLEKCSHEALGYAVSGGHTDTAKWLTGNYPHDYFDDPWEAPSNLELIKWVSSEYKWKQRVHQVVWIDNSALNVIEANPDKSSIEEALALLELLYAIRADIESTEDSKLELDPGPITSRIRPRYFPRRASEAMDAAARLGNLPILQWLHHNRKSDGCTSAAMNEAAAMNHLDVVVWLHENRSEGCTVEAMSRAIAHGHFEIVLWLHANRSEGFRSERLDLDVRQGQFDCFRWHHTDHSEENFQIVKWLCENQYEGWTGRAFDFAADIGRLDIMEYLYDLGKRECNHSAIENAARRGHIQAMKWLIDHDMVKPAHLEYAFQVSAAHTGNLICVKFLVSYGKFDYDDSMVEKVATFSRFNVVEWLLRNARQHRNMNMKCPFAGY